MDKLIFFDKAFYLPFLLSIIIILALSVLFYYISYNSVLTENNSLLKFINITLFNKTSHI